MVRIFAIVFAFVLLLSACSQSIEDYAQSQPVFKLETFFNGKVKAYGTVQDASGDFIRRFTVDIYGSWDGNEGVLDEYFFMTMAKNSFENGC